MDRAQAHTLEGLVAATILVGAVLVAFQSGAGGAIGGQAATGFDQDQRTALVETLLTAEDANRTVKPTLLYWNDSAASFHMTDDGYRTGGPPTRFGHELNETFRADGVAFNLNVYHVSNATDRRNRTRIVDQGTPSDEAVVGTRLVTLYEDDRLYDVNETETNTTLVDADSFYADNAGAGGVYNVVEVEVVAWPR